MLAPSQLCFVLHILVETPAALSFQFRPQSQLAAPSAEARLVLSSYGGLLMATNLICAVFAMQDAAGGGGGEAAGATSRRVAGALGFYHLFPMFRAGARVRRGVGATGPPQDRTLGGPWVHLVVHLVCLGCFLATACGILK